MKIHISSSDLLAIESTEKETPDKDAVKQAVEKVLLKENIPGGTAWR